MRKRIATIAVAAAMLAAVPSVALAGNGYGKAAQDCIVSSKNLGQALKNGREVHADLLADAGIKLTPKTWVELGGHCD